MSWYYVSFVETRPEGDAFAGACVVKASDERDALAESKVQGCNPGGDAMVVEVEAEYGDPPADTQNVLIRDQADQAELHERLTPWLGAQGARAGGSRLTATSSLGRPRACGARLAARRLRVPRRYPRRLTL